MGNSESTATFKLSKNQEHLPKKMILIHDDNYETFRNLKTLTCAAEE